MEETNSQQVQSCPRCRNSWTGVRDYCPACAEPISASAIRAQEDETRGCLFFVQMMFALFFLFIGLALVVIGVAANSNSDPLMRLAFLPGVGISLIASVVITYMLRGYMKAKRRPGAEKNANDVVN